MKKISKTFFLAGALAACGTPNDIDRSPEISDISLNSETMPEITQINVPMPRVAQTVAPQRAEGASLWQSGSGSFFDDKRANNIGDIVTINVTINDDARLNNQTSRSREGATNFSNPSILGRQLTLPGENQSLIELSSDFSRTGAGEIQRNERISLKLAAMVIEVLPNGNFVVAGRQEVRVNDEIRELRVAGIVKAQDIAMDNSINYEKIAEARITYGGRGQISRQQRTTLAEDGLNVILPY
jgi:flagellar L-ring protein precursor FlgH